MSDFFDRLANSAKQAQSDRLIRQSQKKLLSPFATYQGKDPVDGTDRVAIDGVINSGFKLISNAPVSVGERVYLRKNTQGGLQRVDAMNRPIIVPVPTPEPPPVVVDNVFTFGFALFADLRVDLTVYDEFGEVDQSGSYTNSIPTSLIFGGSIGFVDYGANLNLDQGLVYSDPERRLVDKLIVGTTGEIDITAMDEAILYANSDIYDIDPIFHTYSISAGFSSKCAYDEFSASSTTISKLTKIGFRLPQISDPDVLADTITPIPPYTYDLIFSASNFYVVPYAEQDDQPLSDGLRLVANSRDEYWDGEVYDTGNTLIRSWSNYNRNDDPNGEDGSPIEMFPSIALNSGEYDFDLRGFAIDDMSDGEIRDVDYWWRYKRNGAANWYDL